MIRSYQPSPDFYRATRSNQPHSRRAPEGVSERPGHASVALTLDTYSHVLPSMRRAAAEKIENILKEARADAAWNEESSGLGTLLAHKRGKGSIDAPLNLLIYLMHPARLERATF